MNQTSGYTSDGIGFQKQDTSHKAATQNKKNKLSLRQEVLQYFKENQTLSISSGTVASGSYYHPTSGTDNTGGGGGGTAHSNNTTTLGRGGSGVVILRVPSSDYTGTTSGSPTVTTVGSDKVMVFNSSGSYTT